MGKSINIKQGYVDFLCELRSHVEPHKGWKRAFDELYMAVFNNNTLSEAQQMALRRMLCWNLGITPVEKGAKHVKNEIKK